MNPVEDGFDVAIVVAAFETDSTMISRVLNGGERWCCAAPTYLRARKAPSVPTDLSAHDCIIVDQGAPGDGFAREASWTFERGDDLQQVDVRGRLRLSSMVMARAAVLAGAGIATIPSFICGEDVNDGRLVRVLSEWVVDRRDIRVVYPSSRHLSQRVRLFVDALVTEFARTEGALRSRRSHRDTGSRRAIGSRQRT